MPNAIPEIPSVAQFSLSTPKSSGGNLPPATPTVSSYADMPPVAQFSLSQTKSDTGNQTQEPTHGASFPASQNEGLISGTLKAIGNIPSSTIGLLGGIGNVVMHPIKTAENLGNIALGGAEEAVGALGGPKSQDQSIQTFDAFKNAMEKRYGSLDAIKNTAINDPVGFGADVLTALYGGAGVADALAGAGKTAELTNIANEASKAGSYTDALNNAVSKAKDVVTAPIKATGRVITGTTAGVLGGLTGVGTEAIKAGASAALEGGDAMKAFQEGLRGGATPEELVGDAKNALDEIVNQRSDNYKAFQNSLKGDTTTYDVSPVNNELNKQLDNFNITKNSDGTLDFSRSSLRFNKAAQEDINTIYQEMKGFGTKPGDKTALGIDNLKQAFQDVYTPSSKGRALVAAVTKKVRNVLDAVPGYSDEMKNYSDTTSQIKEIQKSLSLGDTATTDTAFRKLMNSFGKNSTLRQQFLKQLDEISGGQLLPKIAGQKLSAFTPGGAQTVGELLGGTGITLATGGAGLMPVIATVLSSSPRLVGEVINALGLTGQAARIATEALSRFIPSSALAGGVATTRANQLSQKGILQTK